MTFIEILLLCLVLLVVGAVLGGIAVWFKIVSAFWR